MYLAEIHGKLSRNNENKEDILTSNVFSFFKYTDREIFLFQLLKLLGLDITSDDARQASFHFWPTYPDGTEPDLVILFGRYYLLVEAKYHSGFGQETPLRKHQLVREVESGDLEAKSLGNMFKIVVVTADYYFKPDIFKDFPESHRNDLVWIDWQEIAFLIANILESQPNISEETQLFAEDLYRLFLKKNLRRYEGRQALDVKQKLKRSGDLLFFEADTATFRGAFIGFLPAFEVMPKIHSLPEILFYHTHLQFFHSMDNSSKMIHHHPGNLFYQGSRHHEED
jgi:hypothetical protein